jgi:hypothetical protein
LAVTDHATLALVGWILAGVFLAVALGMACVARSYRRLWEERCRSSAETIALLVDALAIPLDAESVRRAREAIRGAEAGGASENAASGQESAV